MIEERPTEEEFEEARNLLSNDEYLINMCKGMTLTEICDFGAAMMEASQGASNLGDEDFVRVFEHAFEVVYGEALKIRNTMSDEECMDWLMSNYFEVKTPKECN